ncbi:MAG TPA: T9SS type A sorting domain-containing protein [Bacteroidota bacterium]|nr:T9SS type A sorting domain-containing protein [Bacteroidota bacterium]
MFVRRERKNSIRRYGIILVIAISVFLLGFGIIGLRKQMVVLPGTAPGTVDAADNILVCKQCHHSTSLSRPVNIFKQWSGSMMAHSARDPIFFAALAVANKYNSVTGNAHGEYCIRCHSPTGWLAGHSEDYTGMSLAGSDFDGVQCDYCHRSVNPLNPDSTVPQLTNPVPGYGNGMHVVQRYSTPKRGPFDSLSAPHATRYDPFQESSELCGVCHDVSNPFYAQDPTHQAPHEYSPLERTYSEWFMSAYAAQGDTGTCQSCHMKDTSGYPCVYLSSPLRSNLPKHDLAGGNTFVPDILADFNSAFPSPVDTDALAAGKLRATKMLQSAAEIGVTTTHANDTVFADVRITNLTGHKLPTGYPDGRRMWLNVIGRNAQGDTVFQSGSYDADSATIQADGQLKVYQAIQGLTVARATQYGMQPGPTLHFALNDTVLFDNRIPPKGFYNIAFQSRFAEPVGVTYADSQYWDVTRYNLPSTVTGITANLYYQTISKEYIEFLMNENVSNTYDWNNWGSKLHDSWTNHGKSQPVLMNSVTIPVIGAGVDDGNGPLSFRLLQNYPNPFNPSTRIQYSLARTEYVTLEISDIVGRTLQTIVLGTKPQGSYEVNFDGSALPTGMYFYTLSAGTTRQTKKMLLVR